MAVLMGGHESDESVRPAQRAVNTGLVRPRQRRQNRAVVSAPGNVPDDRPVLTSLTSSLIDQPYRRA